MINNYIKDKVRQETIRILLYKNKVCKECGKSAECIHHLVYRWKPKIEDIIFLCNKCHQKKKKSKSDKISIIIEDKIDYKPISKLNEREIELLGIIKTLNKDGFFFRDIMEEYKKSRGIISRILKKLELLGYIKSEEGVSPKFYELCSLGGEK